MRKSFGLQPGTLVYTGTRDKKMEVPISLIKYNGEIFYKKNISLNILKNQVKNKEVVNWLNIDGVHDVNIIKEIGEIFKIDGLILEDITDLSMRSKLTSRETFFLLNLKNIFIESGICYFEHISFVVFPNILITFQETSSEIFKEIIIRISQNNLKLRTRGMGYLFYTLLDRVFDNYFLVIDNLQEKLDKLESIVINNPVKKDFYSILKLKKEITKFRKNVLPLKEICSKLKDSDIKELFDEDMEIYLKDLQEHVSIISENTESLFSQGNDLLQLYHSTISTGMNEIMKVLTMISSIFIPLSFLAGLYGMNFENMPELKWHYGYFLILLIMCFIVIGAVIYFKRKKWW